MHVSSFTMESGTWGNKETKLLNGLMNQNLKNMKLVHYTFGYGGKFNYHTLCGKEIHSHSKTESTSIDPHKVTCVKCKKTDEWKQDVDDVLRTKEGIKYRIYLESDVLHASELSSAQGEVIDLCEAKGLKFVRRVFSDVLDYAWHDLQKTWEAVKKADEIYSDSSLIPISGGSYMGAPVIFNGMCKRAIQENVRGKDVYILNYLTSIYWDMIDIPTMKKAFKHNNLFMYDEERNIIKVDVSKIKEK